MAKNAKKNKGFSPKNKKSSKQIQPQELHETPAIQAESPVETTPDPVETPRKLQRKTLIGTIDSDLYERLLKPAFTSFALRRDDEPLRQLVESIVTSIAMHDAYEGYRKIDDIFQRYLYYLESIESTNKKKRESVELSTLCDYWRTQVFMTLIRDSAAIFSLLLPESQPTAPTPILLPQDAFLNGVSAVLNTHLSPDIPTSRESAFSRDLFDFSNGVSFPWLGFAPETVFGIRAVMQNDTIEFAHEFAIANAEQTARFANDVQAALEACLFIDLVHAQHHKIYDEITQFFSPEDQLPHALREQIAKRIRFDKAYQAAYDSIIDGKPLTKQLHRSSRLDFADLNMFGQFASMIRNAANLRHGIYIFHYIG